MSNTKAKGLKITKLPRSSTTLKQSRGYFRGWMSVCAVREMQSQTEHDRVSNPSFWENYVFLHVGHIKMQTTAILNFPYRALVCAPKNR